MARSSPHFFPRPRSPSDVTFLPEDCRFFPFSGEGEVSKDNATPPISQGQTVPYVSSLAEATKLPGLQSFYAVNSRFNLCVCAHPRWIRGSSSARGLPSGKDPTEEGKLPGRYAVSFRKKSFALLC